MKIYGFGPVPAPGGSEAGEQGGMQAYEIGQAVYRRGTRPGLFMCRSQPLVRGSRWS